MLAKDVALLQQGAGRGRVSLLCSVAPSASLHDRVQALILEARAELRGSLAPSDVSERIGNLEAAFAKIRATRFGAIGLFVDEWLIHAVELPFPVRDRVVVGEEFAVRDLHAALSRSPRYVVVDLAGVGARCYIGYASQLTESTDGPFPVEPRELAPGAPRREQRRERSTDRDKALATFARDVDEALTAVIEGDDRPVVLIGGKRRVGAFRSVTRHGDRVLAEVHHSGELTGERLASLAAPALASWESGRQRVALGALDAATGQRRAADGLVEVWQQAADARIERLLVEETFHQTVGVDDDQGIVPLVAVDDDDSTIDDAVDELISRVASTGGTVSVVDDGTLGERGRIAAVLRY
ncbi:MAG: hypothetical protein AAGA17_04720 [Actinomycetota bacterium]